SGSSQCDVTPEVAGTLQIDPLERRRPQQRLEPTEARRGDLLAQDGTGLGLALGIAERGRNVPHEGGVVLANLNFDAHEALPLPELAPLGDGRWIGVVHGILHFRKAYRKCGIRATTFKGALSSP